MRGRRSRIRFSRSTVVLVCVFVIGLAVLFYPTISNYINQLNATHAIETYDSTVKEMGENKRAQMLADADAYNQELAKHPSRLITGNPQDQTYKSLLSITDDGIMGTITIKKLGVKLPIYHGSSDHVLASGAGHLEGSSLPVGGIGTHSVITGHRGLPAAKLFTDLDQLEEGDIFTITVLDRTLTYQVDQIKIVQPEETSDLAIDADKDYCTLLTCTPYAVNTQRLLVRGVRVEGSDGRYIEADAKRIDPAAVAPFVAAPVLIAFLIVLLRKGHLETQQKQLRFEQDYSGKPSGKKFT